MRSIANNPNNHSDPIINITTIIFTPTAISITDAIFVPQGPYLKIQIIPTSNGKDISLLKFWYCNNNFVPSRLNEEFSEEKIFRSALVYSLKTDGDTLIDRTVSYMKGLSPDEICIISKEYTKYMHDGSVLDGFIAGIGAYIAFLLLNENGIFMNQMPFQFTLPYTVRSGVIFNRNVFQHLSLPLMSLSKISQDILFQLVVFIQSFINMWEPLFVNGPNIGTLNEARMAMEIISGLSHYVAGSLAETRTLNESLSKQIKSIESHLQLYVEESLVKIRREVNNLIAETRNSTKELNKNVATQLAFIDDSVKEKVAKTTEHELDEKIKQMIQMEIESSHERIGEFVRWYAEDYAKKSIKSPLINNENELERRLIGLEHRIEVLYNKLESNGIEKIPDIQSHDGNRSDEYITSSFTTQLSTGGDARSQNVSSDPEPEKQRFTNTEEFESKRESVPHTTNISFEHQLPIITSAKYSEDLAHELQSDTRHISRDNHRRPVTREKVDINSYGHSNASGRENSTNKTVSTVNTDAAESTTSVHTADTVGPANINSNTLVTEPFRETGKYLIPWNRTKWVGTNAINGNRSETPLTTN